MSKFIIYGLADPRTGEIRYVGKSTSGLRCPRDHRQPSSLKKHNYKSRWILGLHAAGLDYEVSVLEECAAAKELEAAEQRWIAYGRVFGWPLTNLTDGGDGAVGCKHTAESVERGIVKRRGRHISAETRAKMSAAKKGKTLSPEHRQKIADSNIGKKMSAQTMAKRLATRFGKPMSEAGRAAVKAARNQPSTIEKVRLANIGRVFSETTRAKMRAAHLGKPLSLQHRASIGKSLTGRVVSPETREKLTAANRRRALNVERR